MTSFDEELHHRTVKRPMVRLVVLGLILFPLMFIGWCVFGLLGKLFGKEVI